MARKTQTIFEMRAGPLSESDVAVRRIAGHEALSDLYGFEIDFFPVNGEPLELADLGGAEALLTLKRPDGSSERWVHGMLWAVEMVEVTAGKPRYRARLVPRLERLRHVRRSRVFQAKAVPDIVKEVLDAGEVKHRLSLSGSYDPRDFCLQYRESDLDFVLRLLEDEGIFFYFEHGTDEHVMVLADAGSGCAQLSGDDTVPYRVPDQVGDAGEDEHLYRLEGVHRVRAGKVALKDYDFERPELQVTGQSQDPKDTFGLEDYEYPGGFTDPGAGTRLAGLRLEELRFGVENFAGEGTCLRFVPGATFEVAGHPDAGFDRKLLLVRVEHEARQQAGTGEREAMEHGYRNRFLALDGGVPYRPRRRTRRPVACAETATVVGPGSEEIYPDKHGRVKVQFHWDREGPKNEKSSCWIRLAQVWAGPAWGASFVPRIGQEVLVRFLEGDPDQPVVVGAVFNGANPTPIALPDDKTRSTLRTDSSPGSGGSNELRFEDVKEGEEIFLHAQKDETIEVRNDKGQRVGANESLEVAIDRRIEVRGEQRLAVRQADDSRIGGSRTLTVSGSRTTEVSGSHSEQVAVAQAVTVAGNRNVTAGAAAAENVGAAAVLTIGAAYAINVAGVLNEAVGGLKSGQVGGARIEVVGAARSEIVGKDSEAQVAGDVEMEVGKHVALDTAKDHQEKIEGKLGAEVKEGVSWEAKEFKLEADKLSILVDGKEVLAVDQSGNVTFGVSKLSIDGDTLTLKGSQLTKTSAGSAAGASAQVQQLKPMKGDKAFVEMTLEDQDGNPVANEWFKVEFPDGTVKEGRTDGSGHARVPGPKEGNVKVTFPRLDQNAVQKK